MHRTRTQLLHCKWERTRGRKKTTRNANVFTALRRNQISHLSQFDARSRQLSQTSASQQRSEYCWAHFAETPSSTLAKEEPSLI